MFNTARFGRLFLSLFLGFLLTLLLTGCGKKGPLNYPNEDTKPAQQSATAVVPQFSTHILNLANKAFICDLTLSHNFTLNQKNQKSFT